MRLLVVVGSPRLGVVRGGSLAVLGIRELILWRLHRRVLGVSGVLVGALACSLEHPRRTEVLRGEVV